MTVWDVLGIEYTQDVKKIREAYMECAKQVHPEEHPQEFQKLQAAYKQAVRMAKNKESQADTMIIRIRIGAEDKKDNLIETLSKDFSVEKMNTYDYSGIEESKISLSLLEEEFFWKFRQLYNYSHTRNDVRAWEVFMGNSRFKQLFGQAEFITDLVMVVGGMEGICKDVWDYMIRYMESGQGAGGCKNQIEAVRAQMSEKAVEKASLVMSRAEKIFMKRVLKRGSYAGLTRKSAEDMMFFVPNFFVEIQQSRKSIEEILKDIHLIPELDPVKVFYGILTLIVILLIVIVGIFRCDRLGQEKQQIEWQNHEIIDDWRWED